MSDLVSSETCLVHDLVLSRSESVAVKLLCLMYGAITCRTSDELQYG